ncbi:LuxR C-terminal-related transcriptional regulator [Agromyces aurantiacus]|uniref:LuxR C-terminal-related transcriptional regulator n=1 Tax=Agromyces aurantiacus TaxID=165814 RepID=A0ABV9R585_9MICO|nr:LuxR C-terminal-related transcriptional regulator [Agromyces aurantiacus]MBM7503828.1 putative ATPase/DNA-binding CsgD family transcriptional regulator [Agromyces aurantiacus]
MPGQTLTPRESAILAAVERRLSNPEIASELFISVRTVESHIASLRRKLGADSRAELIAAAGERREASVRLPDTRFVGRETELAALAALVDAHRCVTLTGPGGVGKTRLALEFAARRHGDRSPIVVELEHADPDDVVPRIARALDLEAVTGADVTASVAYALASHPYLLVLDNIDRVGPAVQAAARRILRDAHDLRILGTSRTPFGDDAEHVFALEPLAVEGADAPAVTMFLDRLSAHGVPPTAGERELAARVCARLDGLPLGIELAASVSRHLGLEELAARLERDFAALDRAAPRGRHRTLETTFEWTWDLLEADEREVLCRLAALPRAFDVDLATAVTHEGAEGVLLRLLDHSMVVPLGGTPRRFRLLAVMREFVRARTDAATIREVLERHAEYHERVAAEFIAHARTDDSREAVRLSARLCPDVNAALRWALAARHPTARSLATSLAVGVEQYGSDVDSVRSISMAARDGRVRAEADARELMLLGNSIAYLDMPLVDELAERALEIADDDASRLAAHHLAGLAAAYLDRGPEALEHLAVAERLARELGDPWQLGAAHQMRGVALRGASLDDPAAAMAEFDAAMRAYAIAGDAMHVNNARFMMASVAARTGADAERAARWAAECVDYATRAGNAHELAHATLVQQTLGVPDAAAPLEELTGEFRRLGDARCLTRCLLLGADRAEGAAAVALLEEALSFADSAGDRTHQMAALTRLVEARRAQGDEMGTRLALGRLDALSGAEAAGA